MFHKNVIRSLLFVLCIMSVFVPLHSMDENPWKDFLNGYKDGACFFDEGKNFSKRACEEEELCEEEVEKLIEDARIKVEGIDKMRKANQGLSSMCRLCLIIPSFFLVNSFAFGAIGLVGEYSGHRFTFWILEMAFSGGLFYLSCKVNKKLSKQDERFRYDIKHLERKSMMLLKKQKSEEAFFQENVIDEFEEAVKREGRVFEQTNKPTLIKRFCKWWKRKVRPRYGRTCSIVWDTCGHTLFLAVVTIAFASVFSGGKKYKEEGRFESN